jgi:hypothetical protein
MPRGARGWEIRRVNVNSLHIGSYSYFTLPKSLTGRMICCNGGRMTQQPVVRRHGVESKAGLRCCERRAMSRYRGSLGIMGRTDCVRQLSHQKYPI